VLRATPAAAQGESRPNLFRAYCAERQRRWQLNERYICHCLDEGRRTVGAQSALIDICHATFQSGSASLHERPRRPFSRPYRRWLGGTAAFWLVQHIWERHAHVHALVAGGVLKAERKRDKLAVATTLDACAWRALLDRLHAREWVVYAKQPLGGPVQVLEPLGR
jgi:hypothetical protein